MSNDSFKHSIQVLSLLILMTIRHCTVFSGKLAMATGHAMLINVHLFE
jgi:hypothetical protein